MQPHRPPDGITEADYEAIEDAVMETARGRWFLKEYARRMRAAETAGLLSALERIEKMVKSSGGASAAGGDSLPALAAAQIEKTSERLLDIFWYMRERGIDGSACSAIDSEARQLAELLPKAGDVEFCDAAAADNTAPAKSPAGAGIIIDEQAREEIVDTTLAAPAAVELPAAPQPEPAPQPAREPARVEAALPVVSRPGLRERAAAFIHIDKMPVKQKLALFA